MDHRRIVTVFAASAALALASGCRIEGGLGGPAGSSTTPAQSQPAQPAEPQPAPPTGGTAGSGGQGSGVGGPSCEYPDNHCLDGEVLFVGDKAWERSYVYVQAAKMTGQPNASGEASFLVLKDGGEVTTPHFYRTYRADPTQLRVGQMVIMLHARDRDRSYRGPKDKEEAQGSNWWMARIISVAPVAQAGRVIVSGGYEIQVDAIRLIEGDEQEAIAVGGAEDAHFLKQDHWIISNDALPAKGYKYAQIGAPIQAPSAQTKGDGHFINLKDGHSTWTKNAWRTRPATEADIQLGTHVFMLHARDRDRSYRAPKDRAEALSGNWWMAKVTDNSELYKGVVTVAGQYRIQLDGVRVIAQ
jgi:hypothetical protein